MLQTLCKFFRKSWPNAQSVSARALWQARQIERNTDWMRDFWGCQQALRPGPHGCDPQHTRWLEETDPHWFILKHLCRWSRAQYEAAPQAVLDRSVAEVLGISLTHAALMRLGFHHEPVIWPDTLVERHGLYPWATSEIHAFWAHLDTLTQEQVDQIVGQAALASDALKNHWRELHRVVVAHFPDYHDVIQLAVEAVSHPAARAHAFKLTQLKVRATFEVMAASVLHTAVPCRYLALFGFKGSADLLSQDRTHNKKEARQ